jgi:hypothetical protein
VESEHRIATHHWRRLTRAKSQTNWVVCRTVAARPAQHSARSWTETARRQSRTSGAARRYGLTALETEVFGE